MNRSVLFIGGPRDGQWEVIGPHIPMRHGEVISFRLVPPRLARVVPEAEPLPETEVLTDAAYTLLQWGVGDDVFWIARWHEITDGDAIALLFRCYKPHKDRSR